MTKTITITDPMKVKIGDKAYFKDCDFGFDVIDVDADDEDSAIEVYNPLSGFNYWSSPSRFDHATREVRGPEWPDPHDAKLHVYLGADGVRYIYNPIDKYDPAPWFERHFAYYSRKTMGAYHRDALPLTELMLVPVKDDDNEQ